MGNGSDIKAMDPGLRTQERHEYDSMAASIRASLHGDISHIPQAIRDGKGTEFIPANYCKHFPHDLAKEENLGVVPPKWKTTQQLSDPLPPKQLRVKSGYTGHVPHGRDYIGGSYKSHDNRGSGTKYAVPVMQKNPATGDYPIPTRPVPEKFDPRMMYHDPFNQPKKGVAQGRMGDKQHEYGVPTTAPTPLRIEKVLSGDHTDLSDEQNAALMTDNSMSSDLHGGQRDDGGLGAWVMAGYTGHVPKAREVYGSSYYGPPEGASYHGPYYTSDKYGQPGSPNREAICP